MQARHTKLGGCKVGVVPPNVKRRKVGRSAAKPLPPKVDLRPFLTKLEELVVEKIDKICAKHSQDSEHYDYEWDEDGDEDGTYIEFSRFEIIPDNEDKFLAALEALCEQVAEDGGYEWS